MKRILFNCNQTQQQGLGHFSRCLNLAKHMLLDGNFDITFIGKFSSFAESVLIKEKIPFFSVKNDSEIFDQVNRFHLILFDRYDLNQQFIEKFAEIDELKCIYIDDFNQMDFSKQDLVINFRVGAENFDYTTKNKALGKDYFIFNPSLSNVRERYEFKSKVKNLLLFGSGTNQSNTTFTDIPRWLINEFPELHITHITSEPVLNSCERYSSIDISSSIERRFIEADAIINGGGLIKYEASYCGIPAATLSTTSEQHLDTLILEKAGLLFNIGDQSKTSRNTVKIKVIDFIKSKSVREKLHHTGRTFFSPDSVKNLIIMINGL